MLAIQYSAVYTSACERKIGIILKVDDSKIFLLDLNGEIKQMRRFDIIYMAYYPVGQLNIPKIEVSEHINTTVIKTLYKNRVTFLLEGWMINFSDNKMSFLTSEGTETVIDKNVIWDISFKKHDRSIPFKNKDDEIPIRFVHPYPFAGCENEEKVGLRQIFPQHLLEDPLLIKAELDRLHQGFEALEVNVREKVFYPEPQVFTNISTLSIWGNLNLRYGSSTTRNSSFVPAIRSELSEGLYKYQRVIVTGTAPMPYSVHEEPQTQFYYAMKSGYFHFSLMYDLNRLLVGDSRYKWQANDILEADDRQNEISHLGAGFDYGNFAIDYTSASINYGVRHDEDHFHSDSMNLNRGSIFYRHRLLDVDLYFGTDGKSDEKEEKEIVTPDGASPEEEAYFEYLRQQQALEPEVKKGYLFYRFNLNLKNFETIHPKYSLIFHRFNFKIGENSSGAGAFKYTGTSLTNALYLSSEFEEYDLLITGFISLEMTENESGITEYTEQHKANIAKAGISFGLVF
ncbi:MAG: hypothetical protein QF859_05305 [Candidatus Marinimicrobia bacterium]|nr:hypothetical protein [Candidatus Neomarinimicrobiota bacterium]